MTRHNLGFMVVEALSRKHQFTFKRSLRLKGRVAQGELCQKKVILLMPSTFMNASGESVAKGKDYYKINKKNLLIIVDDVELGFGTFRLRARGSSGGHNGLKSVAAYISEDFARLRIGVGKSKERNLKDYVLDSFDEDEKKALPQVIENGVAITERWISDGLDGATRLIADLAARPKDKLIT